MATKHLADGKVQIGMAVEEETAQFIRDQARHPRAQGRLIDSMVEFLRENPEYLRRGVVRKPR